MLDLDATLCSLVSFLVYFNIINGEFVYDDMWVFVHWNFKLKIFKLNKNLSLRITSSIYFLQLFLS